DGSVQQSPPTRAEEQREAEHAIEAATGEPPGLHAVHRSLRQALTRRTPGTVACDNVNIVAGTGERGADLLGAHVPRIIGIPEVHDAQRTIGERRAIADDPAPQRLARRDLCLGHDRPPRRHNETPLPDTDAASLSTGVSTFSG